MLGSRIIFIPILLHWKYIRNNFSHLSFTEGNPQHRPGIQISGVTSIWLTFFKFLLRLNRLMSFALMCWLAFQTSQKFLKCNNYRKIMKSFILCQSGIQWYIIGEWNLKYFEEIQNKMFISVSFCHNWPNYLDTFTVISTEKKKWFISSFKFSNFYCDFSLFFYWIYVSPSPQILYFPTRDNFDFVEN